MIGSLIVTELKGIRVRGEKNSGDVARMGEIENEVGDGSGCIGRGADRRPEFMHDEASVEINVDRPERTSRERIPVVVIGKQCVTAGRKAGNRHLYLSARGKVGGCDRYSVGDEFRRALGPRRTSWS